jgi:hypothetical protein
MSALLPVTAVSILALAAGAARAGSRSTPTGLPSVEDAFRRLVDNTLGMDSFHKWLTDEYEEEAEHLHPLDAEDRAIEYLSRELGIEASSSTWPTIYRLDRASRAALRGVPFELYHWTSTVLWEKIQREGRLRPARSRCQTSDYDSSMSGVYLSSDAEHARMYGLQARRKHGGEAVRLTVLVFQEELQPDPDDRDISTGRHQWISPQVCASRVIEVWPR